MIKVGITGGIGSGKSIVCKVFMHLGVPVFHSDKYAREIINNNEEVKDSILKTFGRSIFNKNIINRTALANIVFSDPKSLKALNTLIHPVVSKEFENWLQDKQKYKYILKEAAILIESGSYKSLNKVICITCPEEERIRRVVKRDNISRENVVKRINMQMSDKEKSKLSDFIINNDGGTTILPQIINIHKQLSI